MTYAQEKTTVTPESPEVQAMIQKGSDFLRKAVLTGLPSEAPPPSSPAGGQGLPPPPSSSYGGDSAWGTEMLAALVCFHATGSEEDAAVAKLIAKSIAKIDGKQIVFHGDGALDIPIAIIFLSEVNLEKYRPQVQTAMQFLLDNQLTNGAWNRLSTTTESVGSDGKVRGVVSDAPSGLQNELADLEATQFAVFALWYAKKAGISYPQAALIKACRWILRTQNQPATAARWVASSSLGGLKSNGDVRATRDVARAGALIACADALGMRLSDPRLGESLPTAFRLAPLANASESNSSLAGLQSEIRAAIMKLERDATPQFPFGDALQQSYALYSFERLHSFRDHNLNRSWNRKLDWYATIVKVAKGLQNDSGAFGTGASRLSDTALMCLTLQRGLRFRPLTEGTLVGGRGLPGDSRKVSIRGGKIFNLNLLEMQSDVLQMIAAEGDVLDELLDQSTGPLLTQDKGMASEQRAAMLRSLSSEDYVQRRKAIRVLAREYDLDLAPLLIYALSDPDMEVVRFAEDGLRRISRKLAVQPLRENASDEERVRHIESWKRWFRNLRPDAIFIEKA